jgi:hypothetical protein
MIESNQEKKFQATAKILPGIDSGISHGVFLAAIQIRRARVIASNTEARSPHATVFLLVVHL